MQAITVGRIVIPRPGDTMSLGLETSRPLAVQFLERHGFSWPAILDEAYPCVDEDGFPLESLLEGVKYQLETIE
jgi:hypothetical protein